MPGPLDGVWLLDVSTAVLGPWAAQMLGDMGADGIKVEPPEGDMTRQLGPARNPGLGAFYQTYSRTPGAIRRLPPRLGEHSIEVLREVGFAQAEINDMVASGATLAPPCA